VNLGRIHRVALQLHVLAEVFHALLPEADEGFGHRARDLG
jgi:hypothetical protein